MIKPLIKLRKWFWLPIKYKLLRKKYIKEMTLRPKDEIWDRYQDTLSRKVISQRGLDQKETYRYEVEINLFKWLTNDRTEL